MSDEIRKMKSELAMEAKEKKKQKRKDTLTALAIVSSVFIVALLIIWLKGGEGIIKSVTGSSIAEARDIYDRTKNAIIGIGVVSVIIMIVYVAYSVQNRKKSKRASNQKKAFIDYDRLEMARVRVEQARMDAKKQGKKSSSTSYDRNKRLKDADEAVYSRKSRPQGMSEEEYRRMRKEEYERYMSMDFSEDMDDEDNPFLNDYFDDNDDEYEEYTLFERVKYFISEHKVVAGIGAGVLAITIVTAIVLLILL